MEGACWLPDDIALVDANGQSVPKTILDQTDIIAVSIQDHFHFCSIFIMM